MSIAVTNLSSASFSAFSVNVVYEREPSNHLILVKQSIVYHTAFDVAQEMTRGRCVC